MVLWLIPVVYLVAKNRCVSPERLNQVTIEYKNDSAIFRGLPKRLYDKGDVAIHKGEEIFVAENAEEALDNFFSMSDGLMVDEKANFYRRSFLNPFWPMFRLSGCRDLAVSPINNELICVNENNPAKDGSGNCGNCVMLEESREYIEGCPLCELLNTYFLSGLSAFSVETVCYQENSFQVLSLLAYE